MASNMPPMPPPGGQQQFTIPPAPPPKKTSPWIWVLCGCLGLIVIGGLLVGGAIFYGLHKAKQAGFDPELMKRNPAAAAAKVAVSVNPDLDLVSMDEQRGVLTVREKKTGKTVTMSFEDIKNGRVSFEGEDGEKVAFGAGSPIKLPSWFPNYPGSTPQGSFTASDASQDAAQFVFTTSDSPAKVVAFYESELKQAGLKVSTLNQDNGGIVTAEDDAQQREAMVTVSASGVGAQVNATFKSKK